MMDYYQQQAPQQGQQKQTKVAKSINTNVVLYLGELPPDVDQYELHQFIMGHGKFNVESHDELLTLQHVARERRVIAHAAVRGLRSGAGKGRADVWRLSC